MSPIYNFFGGRSTTAFWAILLVGSIGLFVGKISGGEYVALVGTIHSFLIVRAISEDKFGRGDQCPDPHAHDSDSFDKSELKGDRSSP